MPIILTSSARDTHGRDYKVDIYDRDGAASTEEYIMASVPHLTPSGPSKTFDHVIITRSAHMTIDISGPGPSLNFVSALINTNDESRFWVRIYINTFLEYVGFIQVDQHRKPITSNGSFTFSFTATDRLNTLVNYPYDAEYGFEGDQKLRTLLQKVLDSAGISEMYSVGEPILSIAHQYYEAQMPAATGDPFDLIYLNRAHFSKKLRDTEELTVVTDILDGGLEFDSAKRVLETVSCQEVIDTLVGASHSFIMQYRGYYVVFYKGLYLLNINTPQYRYDKEGNQVSAGKILADIEIGSKLANDTGTYLLSGAFYSYLGALKDVVVRYAIESRNNLISGHEWHTYDQEADTFEEVSNEGNAEILGSLPINIKIEGGSIFSKINIRLKFGVTLKIGSYYLTRSATITSSAVEYGILEWSQTPGTLDFITDVLQSSATGLSFINSIPLQIIEWETTDLPIPESGLLEMRVQLIDVLNIRGISISGSSFSPPDTVFGSYTIYWITENNYVRVTADDPEQNKQALDFIDYTTTINDSNSQTFTKEIKIGDDPQSQSFSRLRVWNGTEVVDSKSGWYMPQYPTQKAWGELLSWDIARFRNGSIHVLNGTVRVTGFLLDHFYRIAFDNMTFIMGQCRHNGKTNEYTGQFLQVRTDPTGLSSLIKKKKANSTISQTPTTALPPPSINGPRSQIVSSNTNFLDITVTDLPNPDDYNETEVNTIMRGTRWGNILMHYRATPNAAGEYSIDVSGENNRLVLYAETFHLPTDEFFVVVN